MRQRTFIVTGGTKGIGNAAVMQIQKSGHRAIALARSEPASDFPADFYAVDLSDEQKTEEVLNLILQKHEIDGVINNVGIVKPSPLGEISLDDYREVMNLNLRPTLQITQAILPAMKERGWGRIINISSLTILGIPGRTCYASAKAALVSYARTWGLELAQTGITVNAISPGPIETELFRTNVKPGSDLEKMYLSIVPMHRLGQPEEIGAIANFLLSDHASYITGQTIYVDGGASIGRVDF